MVIGIAMSFSDEKRETGQVYKEVENEEDEHA
jgi:hypothetical protein